MKTRNSNYTRVYWLLQKLADFVLGIVCTAGLVMALAFACLWL